MASRNAAAVRRQKNECAIMPGILDETAADRIRSRAAFLI
jgi:hypothetical protein